jgi:hypothetical protein
MKRQFTTREYVLGGIFSLLAAFPLVTSTSFAVPLEGNVTGDAVRRAFDDRADQSKLRRMRWSVMRDCAQREAAGETDVCPDVNDVDALVDYWTPAVREAAPADEAIAASIGDLGDADLHLLRRARRTGACPDGLDALVPGFQALCEKTVEDSPVRADAINEAARRLAPRPSARD